MPDRVLVAYPYGNIDAQFHVDLLNLIVYDAKHKRRITEGAHLAMQTTNLPNGRNLIVREFLKLKHVDWLWFIDTDQTFPPDVLERLLAVADKKTKPIVGALIFRYDVEDKEQPFWPTVYGISDDGLHHNLSTVPRNTLMGPNIGTGTGCVLIHRSVFEAVGEAHKDSAFPWFAYTEYVRPDGTPDLISEDLTFMHRARELGFQTYVDTSIEVGHRKQFTAGMDTHLAGLPFDRMLPETYVVIPVRDNLKLTRSLLYALKAQGGYAGIFVFDNGSGAETREWLKGQSIATVFDAPTANIHEMWNAGVREALNRWPKPNVAILNNDLELGDQFLDRLATGLRSDPLLAAVGPNYDGRTLTEDVTRVHGIAAGRYDGTGGLPGFAFMIRGELFTQRPPFDPQYEYWYGDNDFLLTLEHFGLQYGLVNGCTVEHVGGGSQTDNLFLDETRIKKERDREKFRKKWGMP